MLWRRFKVLLLSPIEQDPENLLERGQNLLRNIILKYRILGYVIVSNCFPKLEFKLVKN